MYLFLLYLRFCLLRFIKVLGHIAAVPACSSGTLTNVLPQSNVMQKTQAMTPHPVTIYRHRF